TALAVQPDGRIVVVGNRQGAVNQSLVTIRLTAAGLPDPTFGASGLVDAGFGLWDFWGVDVKIQPDGKILVGAYSVGIGSDTQPTVFRYLADGTPDPSFDGDGRAEPAVPGFSDVISKLALQADGSILMVGIANVGGSQQMLVRLRADGGLDGGFGTAGVTVLDRTGGYEFG